VGNPCGAEKPPVRYDQGNERLIMKANVGSYDAGARYLLGCALLFTTVNGAGWWGLLGVIPLISAACNFCLIYWIFGIDTECIEEAYENRKELEHRKDFRR